MKLTSSASHIPIGNEHILQFRLLCESFLHQSAYSLHCECCTWAVLECSLDESHVHFVLDASTVSAKTGDGCLACFFGSKRKVRLLFLIFWIIPELLLVCFAVFRIDGRRVVQGVLGTFRSRCSRGILRVEFFIKLTFGSSSLCFAVGGVRSDLYKTDATDQSKLSGVYMQIMHSPKSWCGCKYTPS